MVFRHLSVMPREVIHYLDPRPGGIYVDGTLGGGGHAAAILDATAPDGRVVGVDRDADALKAAAERLSMYGDRASLIHGNFSDMRLHLSGQGVTGIDGLILDLGVSSYQLDTADRGFSFQQDAPLDMRMDRSQGETAADLVNSASEQELERILIEYGEERWARRIASRIAEARNSSPITRTSQLVEIVKGAIPRAKWEERIHPATRTFQALRIAVNDELAGVERGIESGIALLKPGGKVVVISFHSLEDRIVKNAFRRLSEGCRCPKSFPRCVCNGRPEVRIITKRPVVAAADEVMENPRARSAKLRAAEKL